MCQHPKLERVKKLNGIQPSHNPNKQMILGNCTVCHTTLVMGWVIDDVEEIKAERA